MVLEFGTVVDVVIWVPVPPEPVNQPSKVYPVFVGLGNVPIELPAVFVADAGVTEPPFGSHVMVTFTVVHFA